MSLQKDFAGLLVGIEVHQQLSSPTKLFCACPPVKSEEFPYAFERRLRPAQSELGRLDPAAVFEFSKGSSIVYQWSPESSCLVEADEEPPHPLSGDALEASLIAARLLGCGVVDEVHVMRKIVIDGSNTGGFQRTAVVGLGGRLVVDGREVGVQSVTLEEDAARNLGEDGSSRRFGLDRLGVALVEVALEPVTGGPEAVGRVALHLGRILRSTGRVARGLGTIRQDLNVSLKGGRVVEVKGVQKLNLVPRVVAYEARRQEGLRRVAERLAEELSGRVTCGVKDVSDLLRGHEEGAIARALGSGGKVVCISATGLAGILGWEPVQGVRLGKEVAEVARANSLGGVIYSDEFGRQGISGDESSRLREETGAGEGDALVLLAGPSDAVDRAVPQLVARLQAARDGVPAETRAATDDGETRYMRPRPGSQRMYPETDIPDIEITREMLVAAARSLPEGWESTVARLTARYSLSGDLALRLYDSDVVQDFEALCSDLSLQPSLIASTLIDLPVRLAREGVPDAALTGEALAEVLRSVDGGEIAKEAVPDVLRAAGSRGVSVRDAVASMGLRAAGEDEITRVVESVIAAHPRLVEDKGQDAFSALMGEAMKQLRGRADGAAVGRVLNEKLARRGEAEKTG
jgi:glutamyl-tRNA(Gln) amidotransferase subunit E